jgi:crotonobetainyl-CoA:carnitine CoA-transferase CaiB-like acyl-CoA transferase
MAGALDNIKVLDLSRILAGPWASQLLADLGAQVIKIENPEQGDDTRQWGPPFISAGDNTNTDDAAYFHCTNRNKQSVAVDISKKSGQQIIKDLIVHADVLIENHKVGGLAKYGLSYKQVKQINEKLIYCSITGFGQTGPCAHLAGYDAMIQGEGGLMSLTGEPDGMPMKVGVALVDVMTGLYSCNAILAALFARSRSNQGQYIDIALLDVQMAALANQAMNYLSTGENPQRLGNGHPNIVPYQTFATSDGALIIAIGNDQQFKRFADLVQCLQLLEKKYQTNHQRVQNRDELIPIIGQVILSKPTFWWLEQLQSISVPCGAVNTVEEVIKHPQIKHRGMVKTLPDQFGNRIDTVANPINLSKNPVQYHSASPALGQHTEKVLTSMLGYSEVKLAHLFQSKVIA